VGGLNLKGRWGEGRFTGGGLLAAGWAVGEDAVGEGRTAGTACLPRCGRVQGSKVPISGSGSWVLGSILGGTGAAINCKADMARLAALVALALLVGVSAGPAAQPLGEDRVVGGVVVHLHIAEFADWPVVAPGRWVKVDASAARESGAWFQ
jgi:hypothetical protein